MQYATRNWIARGQCQVPAGIKSKAARVTTWNNTPKSPFIVNTWWYSYFVLSIPSLKDIGWAELFFGQQILPRITWYGDQGLRLNNAYVNIQLFARTGIVSYVPSPNLEKNSRMLCIGLVNLQFANFQKSCANLKKIDYPNLLAG